MKLSQKALKDEIKNPDNEINVGVRLKCLETLCIGVGVIGLMTSCISKNLFLALFIYPYAASSLHTGPKIDENKKGFEFADHVPLM